MDCKLRAKNCGGCPMLGMDYAAQLKQKEETVKSCWESTARWSTSGAWKRRTTIGTR